MKSDNPSNRTLLNITLLAVLAPLYGMVLFGPHVGVADAIIADFSQGRPFASPLIYVLAGAYLASIVWLVWRGAFVGPMALVLLTMVSQTFVAAAGDGSKRYQLLIGSGRPVLGIDVYCNDVHLGKTPLTITETEFNKKVEPWNTPPDQPIMQLGDSADNDRYSWGRFYYVPQDIFEMHKQWPPDHQRYSRHNDEENLNDFKASKYWWHFEKNGCVGLTRLANFGGGSGGGNVITIRVNPDIKFLSADEHLRVLLAQLRAADYKPSQRWLEHFLEYQGLLFLDFYPKARNNPKLEPVLEALVRAEFDLPEPPSEEDVRRVVDEIIARTAEYNCFTVPSLESLGIEMAAEAHSGPIVDRFLQNLDNAASGRGRASSDNWTTYRRYGPRAVLLPLEHAIKKTAPPELFDRLVYMSRDGDCMELLANYQREEVVWLFSEFLRKAERRGGRMRDSGINKALTVCTQVRNPLVEDRAQQFVRENAGEGHGFARFHLERFVTSRINDPATDQGDLAEWVFHWARLEERVKMNLLARIHDPKVYHYIHSWTSRNQNLREDLIYQLDRNPNPALDEFLIDSYKWYESPQSPGYWSTSLTNAIVKTNTQAIRRFIEDKWNADDEQRLTLINRLASGQWRQPHMNWLVPMIAKLDNRQQRLAAVKLLPHIGTDDAWRLAEKWAGDADEKVAGAAAEQLEIRQERITEQQRRLTRAEKLLSDRIKPDDLLEPFTPYTWNGQEYVPENTEN